MYLSDRRVVQLDGIVKDYRTGDVATRVLKGIDFEVERGEFVSIMGPSGSGKSTLMNILGTLDQPSGGDYFLGGVRINNLTDEALAAVRNRMLGFVFQGFNLLPRRSIIDNIALPLLYAGKSRQESVEAAEGYLAKVGLSSHRDYLPTQLSGGQQQRIAIARALCSQPQLLLADEPTGNLDTETSKDIMQLFTELNQQGITILLVTHEPDIARYSSRLLQLKDGEVIYDGPSY